jgi:hypothetical protein
MAQHKISNALGYVAKLDAEIRWHREHPGKTAIARRGSRVSLALLTDARARVVTIIRDTETRHGLEGWSGL